MSFGKDEEDRERPSWRDIDRRRDRSRHAPEAKKRGPRAPKAQAEWVRKLVLRQAEALFKGKRGRPEYQEALQALEAHHGTKKFPATAKKFLEEYGLPEEWGALTRLLDYPDPPVVAEILEAMAAQLEARTRVEQQGFKGRLQILALTSPHEDLRRCAEELLEGLGRL